MRPRFKLGLNLLIGGGLLACTCAAYDVEVGHFWGTLLQVVGLRQTHPLKEIFVEAGQELSVSGHNFSLRTVPPDELALRLAWAGIPLKDGWVAFQGQTLESAVAEFNRHNVRQLVIDDVAIRQRRIGGKFRVTDIDGFVDALALTHGVKATRSTDKPQVIVLTGDGSGSADPGPGK